MRNIGRYAACLLIPFATTLAVAQDQPGGDATQPGIKIQLYPKPYKKYVHTTTTRTKTMTRAPSSTQSHNVADGLTSIVEFSTWRREFNGDMPVEATLKHTESNAFGAGMAPIQHSSPLKHLEGAVGQFLIKPDSTVAIAGYKPGTGGPATRTQFHALVRSVIFGFEIESKELRPGDEFETLDARPMPIGTEVLNAEVLRKYVFLRTHQGKHEFGVEIVVRPEDPNATQQIFGRGRGALIINPDMGLIERSSESVTVEARIKGPGGWLLMKSDADTETLLIMTDAEHKPRGT